MCAVGCSSHILQSSSNKSILQKKKKEKKKALEQNNFCNNIVSHDGMHGVTHVCSYEHVPMIFTYVRSMSVFHVLFARLLLMHDFSAQLRGEAQGAVTNGCTGLS